MTQGEDAQYASAGQQRLQLRPMGELLCGKKGSNRRAAGVSRLIDRISRLTPAARR